MIPAEAAQLMTAGALLVTAITGVGTLVQSWRIRREVKEVHRTTNGMSLRNEAIAQKLGVEIGKAEEKANPT